MMTPTDIKKISVEELTPGMYVHDLDCGWLQHPFLFNQFAVTDESVIERIVKAGIRNLYIDTERGDDVPYAPTRQEVSGHLDSQMRSLAEVRRDRVEKTISLAEERRRAASLYVDAAYTVQNVLVDAQWGHVSEIQRLEPVVERIVDSVFRHPDALIPLSRLKRPDNYTFEHAVASAGMMAAFGRNLKLDREKIHQIVMGAMLQDIGMTRVPGAIIGKTTRLSPNEVALVRGHVNHSHDMAQELAHLPEASLEVIAQHHERVDGSGYPFLLQGDQISVHGQMAAIVDVYDALTSQRPFQDPVAPTTALRKLFEWSQHHFDGALVQAFIRTVGIYPVGSLVRLESGVLGVVVEQTDDLLKPVVRIFFNSQTGNYFSPQVIRIGRVGGAGHGPIVSHESFQKWNINPVRWIPA